MSVKVVFGTIIFFILSVVFFFHYLSVGQAVYGDGIYYYAYTRSLYKDNDILFRNELGHHYSPLNNNASIEEPLGNVPNTTSTGYIPNKYPIGAPLAWLPAFFIGELITTLGILFHFPLATLGYSDIYQVSIGIENILFVIFGLFFLYDLLIQIVSKKLAVLAILLLLFGTNLFYYGSIDVINSHPFSFFLGSLFLYHWWISRIDRKPKEWFSLGLLYGLLCITRTQDCLFIVLIGIEQLTQKKITTKVFSQYGLFFLGTFITLLPQLIVWKILYGSYFISPYIQSGESFHIAQTHVIDLFINTKIGMVHWTPFVFLMGIGLFFPTKHSQLLSRYAIIFIVLQVLLIGSWSGWNQGESFGIRMLISTYPLLSIGIVNILKRLEKKNTWLIVLTCIVIIWNMLSIGRFLLFQKGATYDMGEGTHAQSIERFEKLLHISLPRK